MYSRTATQFDLMMKTIMIVLFVFGLFVFFVDVTKAAQWVNNPANCATQSPGGEVVCQTPELPDSRVCGVSGVQYYCFSSVAVFSAPGYTQNNNQNRSGLGGGYIMDCEANDGVPPSGPFCDNSTAFWCNSDVTCNDKFRITQCSSSKWAYEVNAFSCTDCISTRLDCSGDDVCEVIKNTTPSTTVPNTNYGNTCNTVVCQSGYGDCNSNLSDGCEIQFNVSTCTTGGGEPGVWTACGVCTALPPKYFLTASNTDYYSDKPLLWGTQLGNGDLVSFSNATSSNIFVVKNDASVFMSSTLATTTEQYFYNYNGDLYWGDIKLNTGGGIYTAGNGLNLNGYEFTVSTTQEFNWTGQHTFNTTTTFPLGVWGANGRVGVNTTTLNYALNVQMEVGTYGGFGIYGASGNLLGGFGNQDFTGVTSNGAIALYYENSDPSQPHTMFSASGYSFLASSTLAIGSTKGNDGWDSILMIEGGVHIENGVLRFNGASGTIDQVLRISSAGFPEWVDVDSLFINNTTFNSSTEFNSTSTFNSSSIFNDATEFNSTSTFNSVAIFNNPTIFNDNVFVSGTIYSDNLTVYGTTTLNDIYVTGQAIFHDILPEHNLAYTLGTSSLVWKEGWFGKIIAENILFGENGLKIVTTTDGGIAFASSSDDIFLKIFSTGQVAVGTTTITSSLKMKVAGDFGATRYCDENGENCFDPAGLWTDLPAREIMTTTDKYSGNITTTTPQGTLSGYRAANAICNAEFSGSHFCFTGEIINIIAKRDNYVSSTFGNIIHNGWIAEGPPGYIAPANDCRGFTTSSNSILGAWWDYNKNGGMGWRVNCSELFPLSCCK